MPHALHRPACWAIGALVTLVLALHFLAFSAVPTYSQGVQTYHDQWKHSVCTKHNDEIVLRTLPPPPTPPMLVQEPAISTRRANAAFVILVRNSELGGILDSLASLEMRFNRRYHYPYVFLNNEDFSDDFIERTSAVISSEASYGYIAKDHWEEPSWINQTQAAKVREEAGYMYGHSQSYRRMCHYQSGGFFHHPLLQDFDWYWRVEVNVQYSCDILDDPFVFMEDNNKVYGWSISLPEQTETIPSLWKTTTDFLATHPQHVAENNALEFISDDNGISYNSCHFWSNFEIASLKFWRGEAYQQYFDHLDRSGGFFYERWGDAPVHTLAAALFLDKSQLHHFDHLGYQHDDKRFCPDDARQRGCSCVPEQSISRKWSECHNKYMDRLRPNGLYPSGRR